MVAAPTSFEAPPSSPGSRAHVKKFVLKKHEGVLKGGCDFERVLKNEGVKAGVPTYEHNSHSGDARPGLARAPGDSVNNETRPQGVLLPAP